MCGIGGCVVPAGAQVPRDRLAALVAALGHRGPDDTGVEVVGQVGLVQARLAIVDPSPAGHAPMRSADGGWWLTYNGEAFNHIDLRSQVTDVAWRGGSDTETLLERLAADGDPDAVLARINGFFGLAALDVAGRTLHLARDRWGVKPLCWTREADGTLWFASELGALRAAGVRLKPDVETLEHGVALGWVNGPRTVAAGVRQLLGGERLELDVATGAVRTLRWARPAELVDPTLLRAARSRPRPAARAALAEQLDQAVARRLLADVAVGTMCSGGIDSSVITALVAARDPGVLAFNAAIADQPDNDEHEHAAAVAAHLGVELVTVRVDARSWREDFVRTCRHIEAPMLHPSSVAMLQIARAARERGVEVLLSGEGADELFGGYAFLHAKARRDHERRGNTAERLAREAWRWLGRHGVQEAAEPGPIGLGSSPAANRYERRVLTEACDAYRGVLSGAEGRWAAGLLADLSSYLPHLLNRQDKAVMACSVEMREPFLDAELVRFVLSLPLEQRVEPGVKGLLRELALERLPRSTVERPKRGFGIDAGAYLRGATRPEALTDGALRELLGLPHDALAAAAAEGALLPWSTEVLCRTLLRGESDDAVERAIWR